MLRTLTRAYCSSSVPAVVAPAAAGTPPSADLIWHYTCAPLQAPFFDAVVKVHCVHTEPNYSLPWQRKRQFTSTSSGFIVAGPAPGDRWLLTNAHSVDYHTQVPTAASK
jgi:hypothetical protein